MAVMKASEFVAKLKDVAQNYKTLYVMGCFGAPLTGGNVSRYCNNHAYNKQAARTKMIKAAANQNPPVQYAVYSTTTTEASHQDDMVTSYRTFVYLNLWSDIDPTETANRIRAAMYDAGFALVEESDKGYNQPAYDTATTQYTVQWTWCLRTEVKPNDP